MFNRGVPASSYNKAQLIILAKAVFEMDLQVDPNFDDDNLTPHLQSWQKLCGQ